jgi:hypothetical protein
VADELAAEEHRPERPDPIDAVQGALHSPPDPARGGDEVGSPESFAVDAEVGGGRDAEGPVPEARREWPWSHGSSISSVEIQHGALG